MIINQLKSFLLAFAMISLLGSCGDDDEGPSGPNPTGNTKTYTLNELAVPGISGTATFIELDDGSTTIDLDLQNTPAGGEHPAHIHFNTAVEGGGIALTLAPVDGDTGESSINISALNDGTPVSFFDLLDFDGYINVHLSSSDLATIVAQGDIGQNELTGTSKTYALNARAVEDISGTVTFEQRENGEALATIQLMNTPAGGSHPAHIHQNTAAEGGGILLSFNPVNGDNGISKTNISKYDDDSDATYEDMLSVNGYINVHLSMDDLATIVGQGDIGQNELTGESITYQLVTKDVPGISGEAIFEERNNGTTLVTLQLTGTPEGGTHPAHIHENSAEVGGGIAVSLNAVDGTTGMSKTQVAEDNNSMLLTYEDLLTYDGYINVHLSPDDLATIVAQGNIGSNAN